MKKIIVVLSLIFSSSAMADSFKLHELPRVPKGVNVIPISDAFDAKAETLKTLDKTMFAPRQENRFTGLGMKRSFYTGALFNYKSKNWSIPLFNDWYIDGIKTMGCFKPAIISLKKYRANRTEELGFNVWYDSKQCILQDKVPHLYNIVYLNGRYVVITTNINAFVFDSDRGKILNDYLDTDGKVVQYFITEDKQIAVKASKDFDYDGTLRYFKNNDESLYRDLSEAEQIYLERLMEFFDNPINTTPSEVKKWKMKDFQEMKFNK